MNPAKQPTDQFRVSSLLKQRLVEHGIALPAVLRRAGLPGHFLEQEKILATTAQLFALWEAIGEVSGNPAIGLAIGADTRFERYDPLQLAAVCSRNFRDALERVARCKILTCPEEIRIEIEGDEAAVQFVFLNDRGGEPDTLVDVCLSWIHAIGERGTNGQVRPLRLELARPSGNRDALEKHFGCRVRLKATRNALVYRSSDLDRPMDTYNEELLNILGAQLDTEVEARLCASSVSEQVKHALKRSLAGGRPSREDVARDLHLSVRTLQRRLGEAGTTFQQELENTRRELARQYLRESTVELSEAAFLLGYADTNSFFRAFQTWEGVPPGEWRRKHRANHHEPIEN
ncbi:MAG: AraC family transcriptional regulator ligand-binding domain-containing protein [Verrucomicrobiae bacterium]|nr:AraC family transcriptional regulator ligand-binding domain-containing protein [Verrucomicrobiae bacterium]